MDAEARKVGPLHPVTARVLLVARTHLSHSARAPGKVQRSSDVGDEVFGVFQPDRVAEVSVFEEWLGVRADGASLGQYKPISRDIPV